MTTPEYTPSNGDSVVLDDTTFGVVTAANPAHKTCALVVHGGGVYYYGINFDRLKPLNVAKAVELYLKAEEKPKLPEPKTGPIVFWSEPTYTFLDKMNMAVAELTDRGYYVTAAGLLEVMSEQDENAQETWDEDEEE